MDPVSLTTGLKTVGFLKDIIETSSKLRSLFPVTPNDALDGVMEKTLSETERRFQKLGDIYLLKSNLIDFLNSPTVDKHVKDHFVGHTIDYNYLAKFFEKNYFRFAGKPSTEDILKYFFKHLEVNLMSDPRFRDMWFVTQQEQIMHNLHALDHKIENINLKIEVVRNETISSINDPPIKRLIGEFNYANDFINIGSQEINKSNSKKEPISYTSPNGLENYWEDLLGPKYAFGDQQASKQKLFPGDFVELNDVLLTEWFPVVPGSSYQRDLFETNLKDMQVRLGSIRFNNQERTKWKILSAHFVNPFVAHNEVCRGIPVIIDKAIYDSDDFRYFINHCGAIHIQDLNGRLLQIPHFYENRLRAMYKDLGIPFINGTYRSPVAITISREDIVNIAHEVGTPDPLLGTAWTVWDQNQEFDWHYFWIGIEDHDGKLEDAVAKIENRSLVNSNALIDFDQLKPHFPDAKIWPGSIMEHS